MKVFTYSQVRQNLSKVLTLAQQEEVEIQKKDGSVFSLRSKEKVRNSPFDVPGVNTEATMTDILSAVRESRER